MEVQQLNIFESKIKEEEQVIENLRPSHKDKTLHQIDQKIFDLAKRRKDTILTPKEGYLMPLDYEDQEQKKIDFRKKYEAFTKRKMEEAMEEEPE